MSYTAILAFVLVYLVSFAGLGIYVDEGYESGKLTATEYRQGMRMAYVPAINTLVLILCLACALIHCISFSMWTNKTPNA